MQSFYGLLKKNSLIFFIILMQLFCIPTVFAAQSSPVGLWQTIDDETNKPRSIVQITQQGEELRGSVVKVFSQPGVEKKELCEKCEGPNHNKPIIGMIFLWGMKKQEGNEWSGGRILDPKTGKIYKGKMTLSADGQQLKVRGYIGTPLLGRSQVWLRQADNKAG